MINYTPASLRKLKTTLAATDNNIDAVFDRVTESNDKTYTISLILIAVNTVLEDLAKRIEPEDILQQIVDDYAS